jgi:hypothetical protein
MIEHKVRRLNCSNDECVQRLREAAERAFEAGDIAASLRLMKFVPSDAQADRPQTPAPAGTDFS